MASDKKSTMDEVMKRSKQIPGAGKYETFRFDETFNKCAKNTLKYQNGQQKYTYIDEQVAISSERPSFYNPVDIVSCLLSFIPAFSKSTRKRFSR